MRRLRLKRLPENVRREIRSARRERGWSQLELGRRAGLAQRHVSGLETGRIVPRYDTLLDVLRVLDRDLVVAPRALVPVMQALVRDHRNREAVEEAGERPLYAVADDGEEAGGEARDRNDDLYAVAADDEGGEAERAYGDEEEGRDSGPESGR